MEKAAASIVTDRRSLLGGAAAALLPAPPWSAVAVSPSNPNELWLAQPATEWVEGLPVGNGRLGAMIFGRVGQERLQLSESHKRALNSG